jgi:hypothetical protein
MRAAILICLAFSSLWAQRASSGLSPRSQPSDYAAHAEDKGVRIAAEVMSLDQVRNSFSTDLSSYVVVEVAVWPAPGKNVDLSAIDFSLKLDGRSPIRVASPGTIAGVNQRKSQSRGSDIVLFPTVGVTTGTWGTGTNVGVGVGTGGPGAPGPASTDRDRRVMEQELDDQTLPDAIIQKPVAGYLFFPAGANKKLTSAQLLYESDAAKVQLTLPVDRK